jgi:hypothetical protein
MMEKSFDDASERDAKSGKLDALIDQAKLAHGSGLTRDL